MKKALLSSGLVLLFVGVTACDGLFGDEDDLELTGIVWQLDTFQEIDGRTTDAGEANLTLVFIEEGPWIGGTELRKGTLQSRNYFIGYYEIGPTKVLSTDSIFVTAARRLPGSRFDDLVAVLKDATSYLINGAHLRIYSDSTILNFGFARIPPDSIPPFSFWTDIAT